MIEKNTTYEKYNCIENNVQYYMWNSGYATKKAVLVKNQKPIVLLNFYEKLS